MLAINLFGTVLISSLLQQVWSRHLSVSLNMSMTMSKPRIPTSIDLVEYCMKETQITMTDLGRFRQQLIANDPNVILKSMEDEEKDQYTVDYDQIFSQQREESLQCFAYCLYEQMGMIKNGVFTEHDLFRRLFTLIIEREKAQVDECMDLSSEKPCETFYKMHVCYNKLKSLEAEYRIRDIIERQNQNLDYDQVIEEEGDETNTIEPKKTYNSHENTDFNMEKENEIERE